MKLSVYAGRTCYIVVPDFLQPPSATALYAPLRFAGFVDEAAVRRSHFLAIQDSIARCFYAIVEESVVAGWPLIARASPSVEARLVDDHSVG